MFKCGVMGAKMFVVLVFFGIIFQNKKVLKIKMIMCGNCFLNV